MVSIDVRKLKGEVTGLQEFLERRLSIKVNVEGKVMNVGSKEEKLSRGKLKDYVERFIYQKNLSDTYKVRIENEALKIVKKKT